MSTELLNSNANDIITTSLYLRRKEIADGVTNNNALLTAMRQSGRVLVCDGEGGAITEPLAYSENDTASFYSGMQTLDISPQQFLTEARFNLKQAAVTVSISGLEELQNSGQSRYIDLLGARMDNAIDSMYNLLGTSVYSDGSAFGGMQLGGLQLLISKTPNTGTVGGIDASRATAARVWRNIAYSASANGYTVNATTITQLMHNVWNQLIRGRECPNLIVTDNNYFNYFQTALEARQRVADASDGKLAEFRGLRFLNADVILDGGFNGACPANTMYFVNTKYMKFRPHKDRNIVAQGDKRMSVNQDASVIPIFFAGEMTCNLRRFHGVLFN
jgi:hypothetical protein